MKSTAQSATSQTFEHTDHKTIPDIVLLRVPRHFTTYLRTHKSSITLQNYLLGCSKVWWHFSVFQGLAGIHRDNENIIEQALPYPASGQDILINKAALSILLSTVVGKYARRPLNHAVRELSLRALARRIVLAERQFCQYTLDGVWLNSGRGVLKTHHIALYLEYLGRYTGK